MAIALDPNMDTAYLWAAEFFQPFFLPELLQDDVNNRALLVEIVNQCLLEELSEDRSKNLEEQVLVSYDEDRKNSFLKKVGDKTLHFFADRTLDSKVRINICLRIWSGCIKAAKSIAKETRSGENSSLSRAINFFWIDLWSRVDRIYCLGVETAPPWKRLVGQGNDIYLDGVPSDSPVRRYA